MNPVQRLSASFAVILLLGGAMFIYQTQQLVEIEQRAERQPAISAATPADDETPLAEVSPTTPITKSSQPDTDPAVAMIAKLNGILAKTLTEDLVIMLQNVEAKGRNLESLTAANLSNAERDMIRQGLEPYAKERAALYLNRDLPSAALTAGLAEVTRRQEEWLAAQLGKDRYDSVLRADEQKTRLSAERRATQSVSRISAAADLTDTQQDQLYAGFLQHNLHPPKAVEDKLVVQTFGNLTVGPSTPDLSEDAEKLLTPAQLKIYQLQKQNAATNAEVQGKLTGTLMERLMPAVQQLLETTHPDGSASK